MTNEQVEAAALIGRIAGETGLSVTEIARTAGVAPSTLTRLYPVAQVAHSLSARTLAKLTRAFPQIGADPAPRATPAEALRTGHVSEDRAAFIFPGRAAGLPLHSTELCRNDFRVGGDCPPVEQIRLDLNRPRFVQAPASLEGRAAYAIYTSGIAMEPRFRSGDIVFVQSDRPPRQGDDVLVHLAPRHDEADSLILIRRLIRLSAVSVELEQYQPATQFELAMSEVRRIDRIVPWHELFA